MADIKKVWSPVGVVSFPKVFAPEGYQGSEPKYSLTLIFEPGKFNAIDKKLWAQMIALADEKSMEKFKKKISQLPANFKKPFRDGEEKADLQGYGPGKVFCSFSSKMKPGIVDVDLNPILTPEDFYPGCLARVTLTAYAYDNVGKGVAFGLQNIQFIGHGTRLDSRTDADKDFANAPSFEPPAEPEETGSGDW